jgi:dTDP-glucose 4,6-dehydratase
VKRILVTGGAGFIGSHLCERMLMDGDQVMCVDNLITGDLRNIEHLFSNERFLFLKLDVTNFIHIPGTLDRIYHLASCASPVDYQMYPIQTLKVGSLGTHKVLGLAKEKGARTLLASTSEVYGDPLVHPQPESYWGNVNPVGPRAAYDESKRFAEALTMAYHRFHSLETRIVRIFNTYGPRMRKNDGRVVPNFINQALTGQDLTVYGDGSQTRSFCYVNDLVDGIVRAMECTDSDPINLGNSRESTILEFANVVIQLTNSKSRIVYKPLPLDDPKVRCPNTERALQILKWQPKVSLKDGLTKTIDFFRTRNVSS